MCILDANGKKKILPQGEFTMLYTWIHAVSPSLYPLHEEDLILPVDLPDLDFL